MRYIYVVNVKNNSKKSICSDVLNCLRNTGIKNTAKNVFRNCGIKLQRGIVLIKKLLNKLLTPLKKIKKEYIPLLMVYFGYGFFGIDAITCLFLNKNYFTGISATDFATIGIWAGFPWVIKMVFGNLIDSTTIFGSNRKS